MSSLSRKGTFPSSLGGTLSPPKAATDLWIKAKDRLSDQDRKQLEIPDAPTSSIINQVLDSIQSSQAKVLHSRFTIKTSKGERPLRDYIDRVADFIGKFKAVGDTLVQYDPGHASIPWAGIRLLLSIAENDSKIFRHMAEGIELVAGLIAYYAAVEPHYLIPGSAVIAQLTEATVDVYSAILHYLAVAKSYYRKRTFLRSFESLLKTAESEVDAPLSRIRSEHVKFEQLAKAVDVESSRRSEAGILSIEKTVASAHNDILDLAKLSKGIQDKLESFADVSIPRVPFQAQRKQEDQADLIRWLSDIPYASHHAQMRKNLVVNSGQWLIESPRFKAWRKLSKPASMWLHGKIGCGKTRLMSSIIQHFLEQLDVHGESAARVAYFYCDKSEERRTDTEEVLRSIVRQLAKSQRDTSLIWPLPEIYSRKKLDSENLGESMPSKLSSSECLDLINGFSVEFNTIILIDGLDECRDVNSLLDAVLKMLEIGKSRVVLSGRDEINRAIDAYDLTALTHFSASDNEDDINCFIASEIDSIIKHKRLLHGKVSSSLREKIMDTLIAGADGMFLWVKLQLDALISKGLKLERDVRETLQNLSPDIEQVYKDVFMRLKESGSASSSKARAMLRWLYCAYIPLPRKVMLEVLSMNEDGTMEALTEEEALEICCNLAIADNETDTFRFAHLSVQEFLESQEDFQKNMVHTFAAERCIKELMRYHELDSDDFYVGTTYGSFYAYALAFWDYHFFRVEFEQRPEHLRRLVLKFFLDEEAFTTFSESASRSAKRLPSWGICQSTLDLVANPPRPLHAICYMGYFSWLNEWLATMEPTDIDWNKTNKLGNTALMLASSVSQTEILQFLLKCEGLKHEMRGELGFTPLHVAIDCQKVEAAKVLLADSRIDIDAVNDQKESALHIAVRSQKEECIDLLLSQGASKEIRSKEGRTPFLEAVAFRQKTIIEKLIRAGVDTSATLDDGATCLHIALEKSGAISDEVVYLLLRSKVDLNAQAETGRAALHYATSKCTRKIVESMVQKGADINLKDKDGRSPLHWAAAHNSIENIEYLLQIGATTGPDDHGRTELHLAIEANCDLSIVKKLLTYGVDIKASTLEGESVLDFALRRNSDNQIFEMVKFLLDAGAKVDNRNTHGQNVIHHAACGKSTAVIDLLFAEGARVDLIDDRGRSPLAEACRHASEDIVSHFIDYFNVDTGLIDKDSHTMLHHAVVGGSVAIVKKILQQAQADVTAKTSEGDTTLSLAVKSGGLGIVNTLLAHGAFSAASTQQDTLLHSLIMSERQPHRLPIAKALIEAGLKMDIRDEDGWTALHCAMLNRTGHLAIVKLLLANEAEIEARASDGRTPLSILAMQQPCNTEVFHFMLECGAEVNTKDNDHDTPLHYATFREDLLIMKLLLDSNSEASAINKSGVSALHFAASRDLDVAIKLLVDHGCPLDIQDKNGNTALSIACYQDSQKAADALLETGADPTVVNADGVAALNIACSADIGEEIALKILDNCYVPAVNGRWAGKTPLILAAKTNKLNVVNALIARTDCDVNLADKEERTALFEAAIEGHHRIVERLLQVPEINVNIAGGSLRATPLLAAAIKEYHDIVMSLLRDERVDASLADRSNDTALSTICASGWADAFEEIFKKPGVKAQVALPLKNNPNLEPVHRAAAYGSTEVLAHLLLVEGVVLESHGENGRTPLWYAARNGRIENLRLLLEKGSRIDLADQDGKTPLMIASERGQDATVKFLLERGVKASLNEALEAALDNRHLKTAATLREAGAVDIVDPFGLQYIFAVVGSS